MQLTVGSLFSGCGGLDLGIERAGFQVKWFAEKDKFCRRILEKQWPGIPVYQDAHVSELNGADRVDLLVGGFPCQPVSFAGLRNGIDDPRWLWPLFDNAIRHFQPPFVIVENVPGLFLRGFDIVLGSLAVSGYNAEWFSLQSSDIGAPHRRKRVFILATHPDRARRWKESRGASGNEGENGIRKENDNITRRVSEGQLQAAAIADAISGRFKKRQQGWKLQLIESVGETITYTDSQHEYRAGISGSTRGEEFADGYFGHYEQAVRRWEYLFGPAPRPRDDKGRLDPYFVEWMMGFPEGWTEGLSRTQRMKMLGNAVQVQCAEVAGNLLKAKVNVIE